MNTDGPVFESVIDRLPKDERTLARESAIAAVTRLLSAYEKTFGIGQVGESGSGRAGTWGSVPKGPVGLIYGRIQSGKTRAMITTAALAFDNHFRIVVVLTSDINRLVDQTSADFRVLMPEVRYVTKDDLKDSDLEMEAEFVAQSLAADQDFEVVIICSKGATALNQVRKFLQTIDAGAYPSLIFDDEGDQATLDTTTRARSRGNQFVEPSRIHGLVHSDPAASLRALLTHNVFVSVTGTPQGIVLQNLDSEARPSFLSLLEAGPGYTGGDKFFAETDPIANRFITLIDDDERVRLLDDEPQVPPGLQRAIARFVVNGAAAADEQDWREFKMLLHPSVKQSDHDRVKQLVHAYVGQIIAALDNPLAPDSADIMELIQQEYNDFKSVHTTAPSLEILMESARRYLRRRKILVINAKTTTSDLSYSFGYNFLIGGNSIGRGLAFKDLLVTYYVREAKKTNMDTVYQHARMFGYREGILPYMKLFLPPQLYDAFYIITTSDNDLRRFIEEQGDEAIDALVKTKTSLRPTRSSVLDAGNVRMLLPNSQLFPNMPIYEQPEAAGIRAKVLRLLDSTFPEYKTEGLNGLEVDVEQAVAIVKAVKTKATNNWQDRLIPNIIKSIADDASSKVILRYRTAYTTVVQHDGLMRTGALGGQISDLSDDTKPVLWIIDMEARNVPWADKLFIYPTVVLPKRMSPWVFNRT